MHSNRHTPLSGLPVLTPSAGLVQAILGRVSAEKRRTARARFAFFGFVAVSSSLALIPVLQYVGVELSRSGFREYFSLLFSDGGSVLFYWKEFSLSLIESLPVPGLVATLVTLLIILGSLQLLAKNIRAAFLSTRLA